MAVNKKTPTLRQGLTVEDVIKDSWLDRGQRSSRIGQQLACDATKAAVQVLIDGINRGERITKGEMMFFFTQLAATSTDVGRVAKNRIDQNGELLAGLLDKLVS
jgi:hypothetical protein